MTYGFPPLIWLRAFEATARHLSFTHAATELCLTQAAVSKQVKLLEQHLHENLFIRHVRRLELTKAGLAYLPRVRNSFELLEDGTNEVFGRANAEQLTIRVSIGYAVNNLVKRLPDFYETHPNVKLRIVSNVWNEEVESGAYDLDIRYGSTDWSKLDVDRLTWDTVAPLCSEDFLKKYDLETVEDLANAPLIQILGYEQGWASWLKQAGALSFKPEYIQVDSSLIAFELAANGIGVALGRSSISCDEISTKRLIKPFDLDVEVDEAFYLVSSHKKQQHPDAETFRRWLVNSEPV